ncbi:MAG: DinB family protein, partial [Streptosporangiaceae bacterium]
MAIHHLLNDELEGEVRRTRAALARVPADQAGFAPHPKSTPLGKLAAHVAQLGGFGTVILTQPELDFATAGTKPLQFESPAQLVAAFDQGIAAVRQALAKMPE